MTDHDAELDAPLDQLEAAGLLELLTGDGGQDALLEALLADSPSGP